MRSLDLTVQLGRPRLDIDVPDALVLDVPVELSLPLVTAIGADGVDAKWELLDDVVDEVDGAFLVVALVNLQCPDPCRIIDGCELVPADLSIIAGLQGQELDVYLDMVARNPLGIATGVNGSATDVSWKRPDPVSLECTVDARA